MDLTKIEEDYLKLIYTLTNEKSSNRISTNDIAHSLNNSAATVTDMIRKLSQKELLDYKPYKGVKLNALGHSKAIMVVRKHRLWEVFLVKKLNFSWTEVHHIAEQLEHIKSQKLILNLEKFLGFPKIDPHGHPIPDIHGHVSNIQSLPLQTLPIDTSATVIQVENDSKSFLDHLDTLDIHIGVNIKILDKISFDKSLKIQVEKLSPVMISETFSKNILVFKQ